MLFCKQQKCYFLVKTVVLILLYYPFSIGLTFFQQWFVKQVFHFPLFIVFCHYVIKFLAAGSYRAVASCIKPEKVFVHLSWRDYVARVAIVGCAASIDIGLSNWSMQYITVSLYTMAKSSSIIFILLFSVILSLERCRLTTFATVALISLGLFLFTYKSTQFHAVGFFLVEMAALCAGLRWACSQLLMQRLDNGLHNPLDMMYHIQPWMMLSIIPLLLGFEGQALSKLLNLSFTDNSWSCLHIGGLILCGGVLALMMEITEYALLAHTSGLTLNICGIAKEIMTLLLAHRYKGDQFSSLNVVGLIICITGVSFHVASKTTKIHEPNASSSVCDDDDNIGLITGDDIHSDEDYEIFRKSAQTIEPCESLTEF